MRCTPSCKSHITQSAKTCDALQCWTHPKTYAYDTHTVQELIQRFQMPWHRTFLWLFVHITLRRTAFASQLLRLVTLLDLLPLRKCGNLFGSLGQGTLLLSFHVNIQFCVVAWMWTPRENATRLSFMTSVFAWLVSKEAVLFKLRSPAHLFADCAEQCFRMGLETRNSDLANTR